MTIDVTELMSDPDFVSPIQIVTRSSFVNDRGENQITENAASTVGSVQPISGKALARLPDALRVANISSFWFKGELSITSMTTCGPASPYPSILVFKGKRYQVQSVLDWSSWGQGWTEGTCVVETPT